MHTIHVNEPDEKNKSLPEICSQGIGNFFQFAKFEWGHEIKQMVWVSSPVALPPRSPNLFFCPIVSL